MNEESTGKGTTVKGAGTRTRSRAGKTGKVKVEETNVGQQQTGDGVVESQSDNDVKPPVNADTPQTDILPTDPDPVDIVEEVEENTGEDDGTQLKIDDQGSIVEEEDGKDKGNPMLQDTGGKEIVAPFIRKTKIEKSTSNVSIKSLFKEWKKDQLLRTQRKTEIEEAIAKGEPLPEGDDGTTLRFDLAIQRNETWSDYQKSDLIHSILYGFYVPPVLVQDSNDGKKWFLDGKQRITTIMSFLNGDFQLSRKTKPVYGYKIAGFKYKDLTPEMQDEIMDETITLVRMKNMTEIERDEMFVKQNSGSPLSRIEMTRAMHSELIESINELANLRFFKDDIELSKKARVRFVDQEIILQIAMLLEEGKEKIKGFGAGHIEEYVLRLKESEKTISDELVHRFEQIATYLNLAFENYEMDEIKKSLKKIHVPIIFWNAELAMKENLQPELFGDFIRSFLISNYSVESKYGKSCQSGSSKKENVLTRLDEMSSSLNDFFKMIKEASSVEEGVAEFNKKLGDANGIERQLDTDDIEE
ncbi:DUF262 domain-containing protein [Paenibacillus odorifer]|uniref:DUF262 domain-containing protein n=1 Tax=Paenibacillus odorifer TaxID=189426 RepID=UPI0021163483|nr:DUF262 domain-containing protein [Paenibacillus odorifer]